MGQRGFHLVWAHEIARLTQCQYWTPRGCRKEVWNTLSATSICYFVWTVHFWAFAFCLASASSLFCCAAAFFLPSAAFSCPVFLASSAALALHSASRTSSQHSIQLFQAVNATYLHPRAFFAHELAHGPLPWRLAPVLHPRAPAFLLPLWFKHIYDPNRSKHNAANSPMKAKK